MQLLTAPRTTGTDSAAGLLLVAEVEAYLRTIAAARTTPAAPAVPTTATAAAGTAGLRTLPALHELLDPAVPITAAGTARPWHHPHPLPAPTLADRLLGRRPTADITPSEHLHLVAAYIHYHGWTQGALRDETGAVCILGAQIAVLAAGYGTTATARRARQRIGNTLGALGHPIPVDQWNDLPTTRTADVHHLLRTAAA